jgi:hypothetical protein
MIPPLFGKQEVGIWRVKKCFPQYGIHIWSLWPNIRFLPSIVAEKNATKNILGRTEVKQYTPPPPPGSGSIINRIWTDNTMVKRTNNDLQNSTQKTKDWATQTLLKNSLLVFTIYFRESLWPCLYGSWNYNYLWNQCLSSLTLWVRIPPRRDVLFTRLCDEICQWFSLGTQVNFHQ